MSGGLLATALLLLGLAAALRLLRPGSRVAAPTSALGLLLLAVALLLEARAGELGTPSGTVAALAWLVGLGSMISGRNERGEALSGALLSLAAILVGASRILPGDPSPELGLPSIWFPVHLGLLVVGFAAFAVAFGAGLLFLKVRGHLKAKELDAVARLPSLDSLDRLVSRSLLGGFTALSAGIAIGGLLAAGHPERLAEPTVLATVVIWGWYFLAVIVRLIAGWQGPLAARLSVVGFAGVLLSLGGIGIALRGWHP